MSQEVEIFASGTHTSANRITLPFSDADLDAIASSYNPSHFEAPVVVGHPRDNSPAYGWVKSLRREGNKLVAQLKEVEPGFQNLVNQGRYKKISASFYSPDSPSNPTPGNYSLRHVGFLGGMAPSVKGLKVASFAEDEKGVLDFTGEDIVSQSKNMPPDLDERLSAVEKAIAKFSEVETAIAHLTNKYQELSYAEIPSDIEEKLAAIGEKFVDFCKKSDNSETTYSELDPEVEQKVETLGQKVVELLNKYESYGELPMAQEESVELSEQSLQIKALQDELAEQKRLAKKEKLANFTETLVQEGKVLPGDKTPLIEFMLSLPVDEELEFSEDKSETRLAWIQRFLSDRPKVVEFKEITPNDRLDEEPGVQEARQKAIAAYEAAWRG